MLTLQRSSISELTGHARVGKSRDNIAHILIA